MKLLVIGAGSIGARHVSNAVHLAETAVFDLDPSRVDYIVENYNAIGFTKLDEALKWLPDGIVVATPTYTHVEIAHRGMDIGASILIEKPISNQAEGVFDLIQRSRDTGCGLYVVTNMRFHPAISALNDNLEEIGSPYYARAHYGNYLPNMRPNTDYRILYAAQKSQGGGVVLDAIHEFDYLIWLFGPVIAVKADIDRLSDLEIDVEDYASVQLFHKNRIRSEIHLDYLRPFKRRGCEIVGNKGMLLWRSEGKLPEDCDVMLYVNDTNSWKTIFKSDGLDNNLPYMKTMEHFVAALAGEPHVLCSADDGLRVLEATLGVHKAAAQENWVRI